ncbi:MAG TPA: hypothetical protein VFJ85_17025 [Acidimicrobiales bacterium]|nr:hypothetical protein [Acidimicrobiales bacterium]
MRVVVVGPGVVGSATARRLLHHAELADLVVVGRHGGDDVLDRAGILVLSLGAPARRGLWRPRVWRTAAAAPPGAERGFDVAVLACPPPHRRLAEEAVAEGVHVVSLSQSAEDVGALLDLDGPAREAGCTVAVGAGLSPGLDGLLARRAARHLAGIRDVRVTAWPGRGRPEDGRDGALMLLERAFPQARVVVRHRSPTRSAGVAVKIRGEGVDGAHQSRGGTATGAPGEVAAEAAVWLAAGRCRAGAGSLADLVADPTAFLAPLERSGMRVSGPPGRARASTR